MQNSKNIHAFPTCNCILPDYSITVEEKSYLHAKSVEVWSYLHGFCVEVWSYLHGFCVDVQYGHSSHANFFFFIFVQMKKKLKNPAV